MGSHPGAGHPGSVPDRGRPAAARDRSDQRLEERRAQAVRRGDADRRTLPVHERPGDRGRPRHGRDPARSRRRRRPSDGQHLRGRLGRRRMAVRAPRGRGQDAGQLHPPRPAPGAVRPGHHQQPRRRPDRAAAGRSPRRRDALARCADRLPQRLLLRDRAGPAPRHGGPVSVRVGHGHGERDARRDPRRRRDGHQAGRPGARDRRPHRVPPEDGRRCPADLPGHDRDPRQEAPARRRAPRRCRTGSRPVRS